jgi:histidyl-tRNA synthetase
MSNKQNDQPVRGTNLQAVRGTRDLLPDDCRKFRMIEETARRVSKLYGFDEIETPMFEAAAVFKRTLGDTSDIISKEMYAFKDLGGDDLVLRPEGTAGIARAFISEGLSQLTPLKLFYRGPMFRYERPQKGRYRQFYQIGVELLGVEKPQADLECLALGYQVLKALPFKEGLVEGVTLHLNTIGDLESRAAFREKLVSYLTTRKSELSVESALRLERNPLRILDSKDEGDQRVISEAPTLAASLNDTSKKFFDEILSGLTTLGLPYLIDPLLVRGLDYYCHTVFEFTTSALGAQNAICAGGRYDNLISDIGGPKTAGVGWAAGVDRLSLMLNEVADQVPTVAVVPMGDEAEVTALKLCQDLRDHGVRVDMAYSGNMGKRMKRADKVGASHAIILGSNEIERGVAQVKDLRKGDQTEIALATLARQIAQTLNLPTNQST